MSLIQFIWDKHLGISTQEWTLVFTSILDCTLYGLSFVGCSLSYWQKPDTTMCTAQSIPLHCHQSSCHVTMLNIQYRYIIHPYKLSVLLPVKQGDVFIIPDAILEGHIHSVVPTLTKAHVQQLAWARVEPWFILVEREGENVWCEGKGILYSIPCKHTRYEFEETKYHILYSYMGTLLHKIKQTVWGYLNLTILSPTTWWSPNAQSSPMVKESHNRPGVAQRVPGGLSSQVSWHSAREGGEVVSLTHWPPLPPGMFLVLIFTRGWVDPRSMVRLEGICHWKIQWHHRESIPGPSD